MMKDKVRNFLFKPPLKKLKYQEQCFNSAAWMSTLVGSFLEALQHEFCKQDGIKTFQMRLTVPSACELAICCFACMVTLVLQTIASAFLPTSSLSCMPSANNAPSSPQGLGRDAAPVLLSLTVRTVMLRRLECRGVYEGFPPSHREQRERYTPRERCSRARARRNHVTEETKIQAETEKEKGKRQLRKDQQENGEGKKKKKKIERNNRFFFFWKWVRRIRGYFLL